MVPLVIVVEVIAEVVVPVVAVDRAFETVEALVRPVANDGGVQSLELIVGELVGGAQVVELDRKPRLVADHEGVASLLDVTLGVGPWEVLVVHQHATNSLGTPCASP